MKSKSVFLAFVLALFLFSCGEITLKQIQLGVTFDVAAVAARNGYQIFNSDVTISVAQSESNLPLVLTVNGSEIELIGSNYTISEEGKYDIEITLASAEAFGYYSTKLIIDKTPPAVIASGYSDRTISFATLGSFDDIKNGSANISDELSGYNPKSVTFSWENQLADGEEEGVLTRVVTFKDYAGNVAKSTYLVTVSASQIFPKTISASIPVKKVFFDTQIDYELSSGSDEEVTNPKVNFSSSDDQIFTVTDDGLIHPLKKGNAKVIITSEAKSSVKTEIDIEVDFDYREFNSTALTLTKTYNFKKDGSFPDGWSAVNGKSPTFSAEKGLTYAGALSGDYEIKIPTNTIGEFDYIEVTYNRDEGIGYKENIYIYNAENYSADRANAFKIFYIEGSFGLGDKWRPAQSVNDTYLGGYSMTFGAMIIDENNSIVVLDSKFSKIQTGSTKRWYNEGKGDLYIGFTSGIDAKNRYIEEIRFYKANSATE